MHTIMMCAAFLVLLMYCQIYCLPGKQCYCTIEWLEKGSVRSSRNTKIHSSASRIHARCVSCHVG